MLEEPKVELVYLLNFWDYLLLKNLHNSLEILSALGANIEKIWTTYEYGKYSTRSQSELTTDGDQDNKTTGLNKDYATSWSYGKMETFNLMIPNLMGGASGSELSKDSDVYQVLKNNRVPNAKNIIKRMPLFH